MLSYEFDTVTRERVKEYAELILHDVQEYISLSEGCMLHYSFHLCIWEILANIADHNPCAASTCHTQVTVMWTEDEIVLEITNQGATFDWQKYLASALPSPDQVRGRGLYIIKSISKSFTYKEDGKTAHITFDRH
ncbi:ATP-binding protein [Aneurinibacillus sp. REN35]|uniref:ATP-binding protein n=1 Tax=Aneurinibacillus sp. REN35 TaxID=3237286 RepID=UPI00352916C0